MICLFSIRSENEKCSGGVRGRNSTSLKICHGLLLMFTVIFCGNSYWLNHTPKHAHTHRHTNPPKLSQVEICYFKYAIFCKNCIDPVALFLKLYTNHMYPLISHHTEFRYRMYSRQTSLRSPQKETFTSVELHTVGDLTRRWKSMSVTRNNEHLNKDLHTPTVELFLHYWLNIARQKCAYHSELNVLLWT